MKLIFGLLIIIDDVSVVVIVNIEIIKVITKLKIPWVNFINEYFSNETLFSLIKELTWAIIHNPEKEQKKLMMLSFKESARSDWEIKLHPLVISILPKNKEYSEFFGVLSRSSNFWKTILV